VRILFLTQLLPWPLDAGPKVRSYYVLRYLAEAGHEVSVACFRRPGESDRSLEALRRICTRVETVPMVRSRGKDVTAGLASLLSRTPFLIRRDRVAEMRRRVAAMTAGRSFDAVHADQLWMAPYALDCQVPLRILDQHNAVFVAVRRLAGQAGNPLVRMLAGREAVKLESFERAACSEFHRVVWVTDEDRRAVVSAGGKANGRDTVIPIATDPRECPPVSRHRPFRVLFLGGMHWPPNADGIGWFADRVWPQVAQAAPDAVLTIVGKAPPRRLVALAARSGGRIEVAGYVSGLGKYLAETAAFIVPIRSGAGMRVKVLDAWCWQLPVVSTTVGAEGIQSHPGENLLLADDEEAFAQSVLEVLGDRDLDARLSANGRATVEQSYDWKKVYTAWDQIYH
jgi:polysaccharide biosynthesis protein PslH